MTPVYRECRVEISVQLRYLFSYLCEELPLGVTCSMSWSFPLHMFTVCTIRLPLGSYRDPREFRSILGVPFLVHPISLTVLVARLVG